MAIDLFMLPFSIMEARRILHDHSVQSTDYDSVKNLAMDMSQIRSNWTSERYRNCITALVAIACTGSAGASKVYLEILGKILKDFHFPEQEYHQAVSVFERWSDIVVEEGFTPCKSESQEHFSPLDFDEPDIKKVDAGGAIVIKAVGDPLSNEGKQFATRLSKILNVNIPLRGVIPRAGIIGTEISRYWPWVNGVLQAHLEQEFSLLRMTQAKRRRITPILLVGSKGTGKTQLACAIGNLLNRHTVLLPAGGVNDGGTLSAVARGWAGARVSLPLRIIAESFSADPCIVVDELDKTSGINSQNGSVMGTLLTMLSNPDDFYDAAALASINLENVMFVATANDLRSIDTNLLDRFHIFQIDQPREEHLAQIVAKLKADIATEFQIDPFGLPDLDDDEFATLRAFAIDKTGHIPSLRPLKRYYKALLAEAMQRERQMAM